MRFDVAGDAIVGEREGQQDAFAIAVARLDGGQSAKLAVVADGMGGHAGGEIASKAAVESFVRTAAGGQWSSYAETLRQALVAANQAIADRVEAAPGYEGMGCTLIGAVFDEARLWFVSVGDSLLFRVGGMGIERLNADHSMAPLIDKLESNGETSADHDLAAQRHLLRSALTGRPIPMVDEGAAALAPGDWFIIATDGLLTLKPETILEIVGRSKSTDPAVHVAALLKEVEVRAQPDQDNATVVAVRAAGRAAVRSPFRYLAGALMLAAGIAALAYAWRALSVERSLPSAGAPAAQARQPAALAAGGSERRAAFARPAVPEPKPGPEPAPAPRAPRPVPPPAKAAAAEPPAAAPSRAAAGQAIRPAPSPKQASAAPAEPAERREGDGLGPIY